MTSGAEVDGKSPEGKEKSHLKRTRGSLGSLNMITGKNNNEPAKTSGPLANGVFSQRYRVFRLILNVITLIILLPMHRCLFLVVTEGSAVSSLPLFCSGESGSEASSEGSDANSQNVSTFQVVLYVYFIFSDCKLFYRCKNSLREYHLTSVLFMIAFCF